MLKSESHPKIRTWNVRSPEVGIPPEVFEDLFRERPDPSYFQTPRWGTVAYHPQTDAIQPPILVTDFVLEYEVLSADTLELIETEKGVEIVQDHFVMDFFAKIDPWFERLAAWISALSNQTVDPAGRLKVSFTEGENLVVAARLDSGFTRASHIAWSAPFHRPAEPATEPIWRLAVRLASDGATPPVVYQLLSEARIAHELEDYRLAIIQAATAVEVGLSERVSQEIDALGSPLAAAFGGERRTLGRLVQALKGIYPLPPETGAFIGLRNRAVHANFVPTQEESANALATSRSIVEAVVPPPTAGLIIDED
jgi:hypothetical protein